MKKWLLTASRDGVGIDFECIMKSETEPDFWTCYEVAAAVNCEFFSVEEVQ